MSLVLLGQVGIYAGVMSKVLFDYSGEETKRWSKVFSYTKVAVLSGVATLFGVMGTLPLISDYFANDLRLPPLPSSSTHMAITSLMLMMSGITTFLFTLMIHASILASRFRP
jgi:hypothetical protein